MKKIILRLILTITMAATALIIPFLLPALILAQTTLLNPAGAGSPARAIPAKAVTPTNVTITGPTTGTIGTPYAFTATVSPISTTTPLTFFWQANEQPPVTHASVPTLTDVVTYTWAQAGFQPIQVRVTNEAGQASGQYGISLTGTVKTCMITTTVISESIYLPIILKGLLSVFWQTLSHHSPFLSTQSSVIRASCTFDEGDVGPILFQPPLAIPNREALQLVVTGTTVGRPDRRHFSLDIDREDYPPGQAFSLTVMAIPTRTILAKRQDYPEVVGVTNDGRPMIQVDVPTPTIQIASNPYFFSIKGIAQFAQPISLSISLNLPPSELSQPHGIMIYDEGGQPPFTRDFAATLTTDANGFLGLSSNEPITHCCRASSHCSAGPTCFKPK